MMSVIVCPLYNDPYYNYSIDLSSETFILTFRWSARSEQWLMDIDNSEGDKIIRGVALVPRYSLTDQYSLEKPLGDFYLIPYGPTTPNIPEPRQLHKTHFLVYDDNF
jgi:hypothetical protein